MDQGSLVGQGFLSEKIVKFQRKSGKNLIKDRHDGDGMMRR